MDPIIQVRKRGAITLPADLRKKHGIKSGDVYHLVDRDGFIVLTPDAPMGPELTRQIEPARLEAGLSIEELLVGLREQRARYMRDAGG